MRVRCLAAAFSRRVLGLACLAACLTAQEQPEPPLHSFPGTDAAAAGSGVSGGEAAWGWVVPPKPPPLPPPLPPPATYRLDVTTEGRGLVGVSALASATRYRKSRRRIIWP